MKVYRDDTSKNIIILCIRPGGDWHPEWRGVYPTSTYRSGPCSHSSPSQVGMLMVETWRGELLYAPQRFQHIKLMAKAKNLMFKVDETCSLEISRYIYIQWSLVSTHILLFQETSSKCFCTNGFTRICFKGWTFREDFLNDFYRYSSILLEVSGWFQKIWIFALEVK